MEKDELKALGLTDEQADKVIGLSNDEIKAAYVPKADYDTLKSTSETLSTQLADRDKDINELKKNAGSNEDLTKQITELQGKYKTDTEALKETNRLNSLNSAIELGITKAHGKNAKAIRALIDPAKLTVKDDGSVDGLDTALESIRQSDAYLFTTIETHNLGTGNQNTSGGGSGSAQDPQNLADAVTQFYSAQQ